MPRRASRSPEEREARRLVAGERLGDRSKLACGVRMIPFLGGGLGERARSQLLSRDFMIEPRGERDPSKLCCGECDLSIDPRGDLVRSRLPRGDRAFVCFRLDLFGDLHTKTFVTRSRSGDRSEARLGDLSVARLGERSRSMLPPLHERITLIFFSIFLSGEDLRDSDSCLPSSLTIVGWYSVGW